MLDRAQQPTRPLSLLARVARGAQAPEAEHGLGGGRVEDRVPDRDIVPGRCHLVGCSLSYILKTQSCDYGFNALRLLDR